MTAIALVPGPDGHAVVRHGLLLARAGGLPTARALADVPAAAAVLLEMTDRLLGSTVAGAADALEVLLAGLAARGCRLVAGLHDLPAADDWSPARHAFYARLVGAAAGVLVCSGVEAGLARDLGARRVVVAPIPVDHPPPASAVADVRTAGSVTVAGFVWPGKGHAEVLAAMEVLPPEVPLVIAGCAAAGHDDVLAALRRTGRQVCVSGFVPDAAFRRLMTAPTIPVAPNRAVSASASIASWWSAGRRPLVPEVPYTRELETRDPGAVQLYDDLAAALATAWIRPALTWLPAGLAPGPRLAEVAAIRRAALDRWSS